MTLRSLNYGNYVKFLIMGNAGFISSTVGSQFVGHGLRARYRNLYSNPSPKGPSRPYLRTLGPLWVPKTISKDYLDP